MKLSRFASSICFAFIATLISPDAVAQDAGTNPATARKKPASNAEAVAPAPATYPTPLPAEPKKKRGFFKRMFGGGKEKEEAAPVAAPVSTPVPVTPAPSPSPVAQKKKKHETTAEISEKATGKNKTAKDSDAQRSAPKVARATASPESTPAAKAPDTIDSAAASATSTPLPDSLPPLEDDAAGKPASPGKEPAQVAKNKPDEFLPPEVPLATPVPEAVKSNPLNQPIALVDPASTPADGVASSSAPESEEDAAESVEEQTLARIRFKKIKTQALEDAKVRDLKAKADSAPSEDARYAALKEYYPALFAQMRKVDASFSKGIDRMEAAANRRLERMAADGAGGKIETSNSAATSKSGG